MNANRLRRLLPAIVTMILLAPGIAATEVATATASAASSPTPVGPTLGADQITSGTTTAGQWCLDNSGGSNASGNPIDIYPCNDTWDGQLWTVERDGTIRIQNRCLDAPSAVEGTQLVLDPCEGTTTPGEQWQPMSDGSVENVYGTKQSSGSALCMGITGGDPVSSGASIIIWNCNGADTQQWHLPTADTKAAVAAARLQLMYNGSGSSPTYLFENPCSGNCWWWSANELDTLTDYSRKAAEAAGSSVFPGWSRYMTDVQDTYNNQNGPSNGFTINPYGTSGNIYYDDAGWWGLTWLNAYNEYNNSNYLTTAENIASYIHNNAADSACGGLWQRTGSNANNDAIVNELFFELAARLNRTTGNSTYLTWAETEWNWIKTHLIVEVPESSPSPTVATPADLANPNAHLLVADHIASDCSPAGGTYKSTYNQGVILGALHSMYKITGDSSYLTPAEAIATTAENDVQLTIDQAPGLYSDPALVDQPQSLGKYNTLSEPCSSSGSWPDNCSESGNPNLQWKGAFIRNLACLAQDSGVSLSYSGFITNNAWSVFNLDQDMTTDFSAAKDLNLFGFLWDNNGNNWPGTENANGALNEATQGSALDALVANMANTAPWC